MQAAKPESLSLAGLSLERQDAGKWDLNSIRAHTVRLPILASTCILVTKALMQLPNCAHEMHGLAQLWRN